MKQSPRCLTRKVPLVNTLQVCWQILSHRSPLSLDAECDTHPCFSHIIEEGAIGGIGQKIGGPFDKEGMIGEQFTAKGAVGGTIDSMMGGKKRA